MRVEPGGKSLREALGTSVGGNAEVQSQGARWAKEGRGLHPADPPRRCEGVSWASRLLRGTPAASGLSLTLLIPQPHVSPLTGRLLPYPRLGRLGSASLGVAGRGAAETSTALLCPTFTQAGALLAQIKALL